MKSEERIELLELELAAFKRVAMAAAISVMDTSPRASFIAETYLDMAIQRLRADGKSDVAQRVDALLADLRHGSNSSVS